MAGHLNSYYDSDSLAALPTPAPFTRLEGIYYFPATDTMYLAGYTADRPHHDAPWKAMVRVLCRYEICLTPILGLGAERALPGVNPPDIVLLCRL